MQLRLRERSRMVLAEVRGDAIVGIGPPQARAAVLAIAVWCGSWEKRDAPGTWCGCSVDIYA